MMKTKTYLIVLITLQLAFSQSNSKVEAMLPELFIQFPNVRDFTISSSEDEAFFTAQSPLGEISVIMQIKKEDSLWLKPTIVPFSGIFSDLEPFLSRDGLKLYFVSNRPLDNASKAEKDYDIWYVKRENPEKPWSDPINIGSPINSEHNEFYPSVANNHNLYFTSDAPASKGKDDIFVSPWEKDHYTEPVSLDDSINSAGYEFNAYIAPDESFLIFTGYGREDGLGSGDLYISYHKADGSWSLAQNLGSAVNSDKMDYCPFVDMKNAILYFTSKRSQLEKHGKGFDSLISFLAEITKYENGLSRIYKVSFEKFLH